MQLGSRWQVGQPPHPGVPEKLHAAVAAAERQLEGGPQVGHHGGSWTLTWLEGRPRVELFDTSGRVRADIGLDADGTVIERAFPAHDAELAAPATGTAIGENDDDDDDWLS
ncbi:Fe-S oxidoreductase [Leucobacter sp. NPDC015123]|uniref:Fe-S oxidoreductase n=1 Tax=Leucobacter sp. NPDC015123 TaxID=3364129 RepID=UPI0036F49D71